MVLTLKISSFWGVQRWSRREYEVEEIDWSCIPGFVDNQVRLCELVLLLVSWSVFCIMKWISHPEKISSFLGCSKMEQAQ
jgi:hypothetical protein